VFFLLVPFKSFVIIYFPTRFNFIDFKLFLFVFQNSLSFVVRSFGIKCNGFVLFYLKRLQPKDRPLFERNFVLECFASSPLYYINKRFKRGGNC